MGGKPTFRQLAEHFRARELRKRSGIGVKAEETSETVETLLDRWILPRWGEMEAAEIRPLEVEAWFEALTSTPQGKRRKPLSWASVSKLKYAMSQVYRHAQRMTSIGVTNRTSSYNRSTEAHDWKRRSERLVRASGLPYTIVRPGWFDYNSPSEHKLVFLQGDKRHTGTPKDGVIARRQIAEVLVESLSSVSATRKTLELIAAEGAAQQNMEPLFTALDADVEYSIDAIHDIPNQPLENEPQKVRDDLKAILALRPAIGH